MFAKCLFYLLAIQCFGCSIKAEERLKDINKLLNHDGWKKVNRHLRPLTVVEYNPDGPEINLKDILKKDGTSNDIITEENYKPKLEKIILVFSAVHAYKLNRIIDYYRVFWEFCGREGPSCKKLFTNILCRQQKYFYHIVDVLNFIAKFQTKGPLLAGENLKNEVTEALKHLIILSGSPNQSNECIENELNSANTLIKKFYKSHFRPVPVHIIDELNNFSEVTLYAKNVINNNSITLKNKVDILIKKLNYEHNIGYKYSIDCLGFSIENNSRIVKVLEGTELGPPMQSDDEEDE